MRTRSRPAARLFPLGNRATAGLSPRCGRTKRHHCPRRHAAQLARRRSERRDEPATHGRGRLLLAATLCRRLAHSNALHWHHHANPDHGATARRPRPCFEVRQPPDAAPQFRDRPIGAARVPGRKPASRPPGGSSPCSRRSPQRVRSELSRDHSRGSSSLRPREPSSCPGFTAPRRHSCPSPRRPLSPPWARS